MSADIHVRISRIVADADVPGLDALDLPSTLESALAERLDSNARVTAGDKRRPSIASAIADAIASHPNLSGRSRG